MNTKGCLILIPLLIGMLFSCSSKQYDGITYFDWDDFPEPMFLEGDSVEFDDILMKPTRIAIVDSFILMKNSNVERFFHIYNLKTKQKVGERIPFGIGPDEMLDPMWVFMPDSCLGVFDRNKKKMHIYSKSQFLNSDKTFPIRQFVFDELLINPIFISGKGVVSSTLESEDNKFVIVGLDGEKIAYFGEFPEYYKDMTVLEKNIALMGDMAVKPDFSRWVMSHKATDMIEIYDNNLNLLKRIQGPDNILPELREMSEGIRRSSDSRECYFFPVVTDDYVYVLYDGRVYDVESPTRYLRNKLLVFDWEGNPVKYYQLSKPIFHFDIDEEQQMLYGLTDSPEFHVISYSLRD